MQSRLYTGNDDVRQIMADAIRDARLRRATRYQALREAERRCHSAAYASRWSGQLYENLSRAADILCRMRETDIKPHAIFYATPGGSLHIKETANQYFRRQDRAIARLAK